MILSATANISYEGKIALALSSLLFLIIEIVAMAFVNSSYKKKYKFSLYGGSIAMFFAIAALGLAISLFVQKDPLGTVCTLLFLILTGIVLYFDIKKCGTSTGIKTFLLQIVLCVGALFDLSRVIDYYQNKNKAKTLYNQSENQNNENNKNF